ncbi:hypothetical protein MTsN2n4_31250 [Pseudoalteromonas sp. MTN2-4]
MNNQQLLAALIKVLGSENIQTQANKTEHYRTGWR